MGSNFEHFEEQNLVDLGKETIKVQKNKKDVLL